MGKIPFEIDWKKNKYLSVALAGFGIAVIGVGIYVQILNSVITKRFEGKRWQFPSKVYSDTSPLFPGQELDLAEFMNKLNRLNYKKAHDSLEQKGDYLLGENHIDLYLHDFQYPQKNFSGFPMRLQLRENQIAEIQDLNHFKELYMVELEPELLSGFFNKSWEERDLVSLDGVPPYLIESILSVEDTRYYSHIGIDIRGIFRAFWVNLKEGEVVQGGSTLTQQLVKNFFLTQERTLRRKLNEAIMALILEAKYSKNEIMETYLNEIYLGQQGNVAVHGVGKASQFYFGKSVKNLTLGESALLAGLIKSPNGLSPYNHPDRAEKRRQWVLLKMMEQGRIQESEYQSARDEEIQPRGFVERGNQAPYFIDFVRQQMVKHYPPDILNSEGLRIFTTLDPDIQREAEESLKEGLLRLERDYPSLKRENPQERLQGLIIVVQPQTGNVKALVGGRDYGDSQFNRATQARRQPGSLFKPIVYLTALSLKDPTKNLPLTGATLVEDTPISIPVVERGQKTEWVPQNYDLTFHGQVTLRQALENSLNVATVRLAQSVGVDRIIQTAKTLGIESPLDEVPSLALGTSEVTPLEMATAYTTLANQGVRPTLLSIKQVVDTDGMLLQNREIQMEKAVTPESAYLMTHLLEGVVDNGTASRVRNLGYQGPVAAKTGTTSDYRDAWFVGYTPELLALVWIGFDRNDPTYLTGSRAALPIWTDLMKRISHKNYSEFRAPSKIVFRTIDPDTGLLVSFRCPGGIEEAFIEGTEPTERCGQGSRKGNKFFDWIKSIFNTSSM